MKVWTEEDAVAVERAVVWLKLDGWAPFFPHDSRAIRW